MERHTRNLAGLAIGSALPPLQRLTPKTPTSSLPGWEMEFISGGKPFRCLVRAIKQPAAEAEARLELSYRFADFDGTEARLVAARQVQ